ncbi:MAG TPA: hypothetical protein EYP05_02830 [Piscirickettsiaceae bacterium]|nr:hypothetical protein [Piscirickettsiaceae bacterium]
MSNTPGRTDWAEDDEPDLASSLPAPQRTKNKDGTETIVTIFLNEDGKKVKRTQRIRTITKRIYEKPGAAERKLSSINSPRENKPTSRVCSSSRAQSVSAPTCSATRSSPCSRAKART